MRTKVKIFHDFKYKDLENQINEFLVKQKDIEIINIKFQNCSYSLHTSYSALLLYETPEILGNILRLKLNREINELEWIDEENNVIANIHGVDNE